MSNDLKIVLMAYDPYFDLWEGFFKCKNKYWNDCRFETIMVDCEKKKEELPECVCGNVAVVLSEGGGKEWTERIHSALEKIDSKYIILWLEDLYIDTKVDSDRIDLYLDLMDQHSDIGYIKINGGSYQINCEYDDSLGEITENHAYRICTQPGIWRKDYLYSLTECPMDAWNFEYQMGLKCDAYPYKSCVTKDPIVHTTNMVWRKKWTSEAIKLDRKENLQLDYSFRQKHSFISRVGMGIKGLFFRIIGADTVTRLVINRRGKGKGLPDR